MTPNEIKRIVLMSDAEYAAELVRLKKLEAEAYSNYAGVMPRPEAGTPQAVGHGSVIGGFVGQEEWLAARSAVEECHLAREQWIVTSSDTERVVFRSAPIVTWESGAKSSHEIDIAHHGVDVSAAKTPSQAIAIVRAALAA